VDKDDQSDEDIIDIMMCQVILAWIRHYGELPRLITVAPDIWKEIQKTDDVEKHHTIQYYNIPVISDEDVPAGCAIGEELH
jgi:hypothetical protein